jgi:hypothetical protein
MDIRRHWVREDQQVWQSFPTKPTSYFLTPLSTIHAENAIILITEPAARHVPLVTNILLRKDHTFLADLRDEFVYRNIFVFVVVPIVIGVSGK